MVTEVFNAKPKLSTLHVSCAKWLLECPPFASSLCSQSDVNYNLARWQVEPKAKAPVQVPPWLSSTRRLRQASWTEYIVDMSACIYVSIYIYMVRPPKPTFLWVSNTLFMSFKYTGGINGGCHSPYIHIYPHIYIYRPYLSCQLRKIKAQNQKNKNKKTQTLRRMFGFDSKDCFFWCSLSFFRFFLGFWKSKNKKHWCFFHKCTIN